MGKAESQRKWYTKNRHVIYESNKKRRLERRTFLVDLKSKPCSDCGRLFPAFCMDFHHRDRSTKKFNISLGLSKSLKAFLEEVAKCDLVCANCHRIREHTAG